MNASLPPARFASVDALRGLTVAAMLLVNNPGDWGHVYAPLRHAAWHGCTPTDLIFPFFLFIVGVSIALALMPKIERGQPRAPMTRAVLVRAARIVGLGLALHLMSWWLLDRADFRPWGVLQRIGFCFAAAGLLAIHARQRTQWFVIAGLLLGHWALLVWGGSYERFANLGDRIDTALFGSMLYVFEAASGRGHDPEGLISTFPAIATALLGVRAGAWLRELQLRRLAAMGIAAIALGALWAQILPVNKALWTGSYVLWTGGWAALALLACHVAIDRHDWPAIGRRFGVNAIAAYVGSAAMVYALSALGLWSWLYEAGFAGWMTPLFGPTLPSLAFALAFVGLWWLVVWALDRRRIHIRI